MNNLEILGKYKKLQNGSDIRGVALEGIEGQNVNLSEREVFNISQSFVLWLARKLDLAPGDIKIAVGRDSRISGPHLIAASLEGIVSQSAKAIDTGLSSTPAMFMSTVFPEIKANGSIMLTASHLPWNRNGMKFFAPSGGLNKSDITEILTRASEFELEDNPFSNIQFESSRQSKNPQDPKNLNTPNPKNLNTQVGGLHMDDMDKYDREAMEGKSNKAFEKYDLMARYSAHLQDLIIKGVGQNSGVLALENPEAQNVGNIQFLPLKGMRIIVDAGNGAGGFFAKDVLAPLGADTTGSMYLDPDGTFPNHPPNPEDPSALVDLCQEILNRQVDLGLIFDTDVDRAAAVDSKGREIARNRIVALAATFAKEKSPGTTVVTDSVTSTQLHDFIENQLGLTHHRFKRGYRNVINESIRLNESGIDSQLAIETSGHGAFKDNYFLDDGAYLATLITIKATLLKREGKEISHILDSLEDPLEALEIRLPISQDDFQSYGDEVLDALEKWVRSINDQDIQLELPNYEGVRVKLSGKYGEGWFLLRKSLHDPLLPLNIESNEAGGTNKIRALLRPFFSNFQSLDTSNL